MRNITGIIIGSILISLMAPAFALLPSDAVNSNKEQSGQQFNMTVINPAYSWSSPPAIDLSGINPAVFRNNAFKKNPGGMSSGSLYTESIDYFLRDDPDAGTGKIAMKAAKIGLVHWP
jgi:hypothetical protein